MNTQRLLLLRKITRGLADALRLQLKDHLTALAPIIRPKIMLGDFVTGTTRESPNLADKAFQEWQGIYQTVATAKPFQLPKDLKSPVEVSVTPLETHPYEYTHVASAGQDRKPITLTAPLRWVITYPGFAPSRLRELMSRPDATPEAIQRFVIHYTLLHFVVKKQVGFARTLEALRFPVSSIQLPEFGNLPVTMISAPISTTRPPDDVVNENTEISGVNVFEEIVNLEDLTRMRDPFRDQLAKIVQGFGEDLLDDRPHSIGA